MGRRRPIVVVIMVVAAMCVPNVVRARMEEARRRVERKLLGIRLGE